MIIEPDSHTFTLYGKPIPQARHRGYQRDGRTHYYDPCSQQKATHRIEVLDQIRLKPSYTRLVGPIGCKMTFGMGRCSDSLKRSPNGSYHTKKPDIDNLCKYYFDMMSDLVFDDDKQIAYTELHKIYTPEPYTHIEFFKLGQRIAPVYDKSFLEPEIRRCGTKWIVAGSEAHELTTEQLINYLKDNYLGEK